MKQSFRECHEVDNICRGIMVTDDLEAARKNRERIEEDRLAEKEPKRQLSGYETTRIVTEALVDLSKHSVPRGTPTEPSTEEKLTVCSYCNKETEFILLDCQDGSSCTFCSWDCCLRFIASRWQEPIEYPYSGKFGPAIVDGKCMVCGRDDDGDDICFHCLDVALVLQIAIMKAKTVDDIAVAWSTWRNGWPPKAGDKKFIDNCRHCGRVIWIREWERKKNPKAGAYCSRECHHKAMKKVTK